MLEVLRDDRTPFVAFVGAGASALPPSRLPTWKGFNNLLLETLCERLNEYSSNQQPTAEMLEMFRARRDQTRFLAPDFQAQLMEEEIGADYFSVWQSLETRASGPVHAGLAELAVRGRLTAIVTTNFDQLIETALDERGVATEVFFDAAGFEKLSRLTKGKHEGLPIIKIHGSIEHAPSLVDTLRQRLVGRPESLNKALQVLLRRSPWLYLGFSGSDYGYDPHYLGVLDAAKRAKGFVFVHRPGRPLEPGVVTLIEAYGAAKATSVEAELPTWLVETFDLPAWSPPAAIAAESEAEATARVRERIREWAGRLSPVSVVNIVCAMLKSAALDQAAFWLLRKTLKSYRTPDDTETKAYQRYNYNYGVSLFEAGLIRNEVARDDANSNISRLESGRGPERLRVPRPELQTGIPTRRGRAARSAAGVSRPDRGSDRPGGRGDRQGRRRREDRRRRAAGLAGPVRRRDRQRSHLRHHATLHGTCRATQMVRCEGHGPRR